MYIAEGLNMYIEEGLNMYLGEIEEALKGQG